MNKLKTLILSLTLGATALAASAPASADKVVVYNNYYDQPRAGRDYHDRDHHRDRGHHHRGYDRRDRHHGRWDRDHHSHRQLTRYHHTPVVRERVIVERPRHIERGRYGYAESYRSATPMILGGVIGGLVGHEMGKGRGKDAATAAGVILGGSIGRDIGYRH